MADFFSLTTAVDLREKLRRDLVKLKEDPMDADAAFNFFVTAEHMLDWVYPKRAGKPQRVAALKGEVLLQVCSHLANGAKHFEVEAPHHQSVTSAESGPSCWPEPFFDRLWFPHLNAGNSLIVRLRGDAANVLGQTVDVAELAGKIMTYWDAQSL